MGKSAFLIGLLLGLRCLEAFLLCTWNLSNGNRYLHDDVRWLMAETALATRKTRGGVLQHAVPTSFSCAISTRFSSPSRLVNTDSNTQAQSVKDSDPSRWPNNLVRRVDLTPPPLPSLTPSSGDSKNTVDKLSDTAASVGQNIKETGEHYANKPEVDKAGQKAESVGQNILDTGAHYADKTGATDAANKAGAVAQNAKETVEHEAQKANNSTGVGEKTYLEQAQDLAASALNTASQAASGKFSDLRRLC